MRSQHSAVKGIYVYRTKMGCLIEIPKGFYVKTAMKTLNPFGICGKYLVVAV